MEDLLKGAYDLHIHTAPDVVQRKCGDLELARRKRAEDKARRMSELAEERRLQEEAAEELFRLKK